MPEPVWNGARSSQTLSSKDSGKIWNPNLKDFAGALCCQNLSGMTQEAARLTLARVLEGFELETSKFLQELCCVSATTQEAARLTLARVLEGFELETSKFLQALCSAARTCLE